MTRQTFALLTALKLAVALGGILAVYAWVPSPGERTAWIVALLVAYMAATSLLRRKLKEGP